MSPLMRGVPRRIACALVVALVLPACAPDGAAPAPPQEGTTDDLGAVRLRNFNLGKSINKGLGQATGAIQDGADAVGGAFSGAYAEASSETNKAGRTAMSSVVSTAEHEWRNASGQIIDGAGNLIAAIPLNWPASLGSAIEGQVVRAARSQIDAGLAELDRIGESLLGLPAQQAEDRINAVLNPLRIDMPKISIPGMGQAYVPARNPLRVHIRESQWESANAANVQIEVDFFGLKRYRVGVGCIGFPNGFTAKPRVALNGGCDNPWNLLAQANVVADTAKGIADGVSQQVNSVVPQMLSLVKAAAGGVDNPRLVPSVLVDLLLNRLLGMCCSLSFPSSEAAYNDKLTTAAQDQQAAFVGATDPAVGTVLDSVTGEANRQAASSLENQATMAFGVPQLQGVDFSVPADLSVIAEVSENWAGDGTVQITIELGIFGLFVASVGLGCLTFGTSWTQAPGVTFAGGCDNSWNVSFNGGGYTSAPVRLDSRLENGSSAPPPAAPPLPAPSPVAVASSPDLTSQGGTVTDIVQNGVRYRVHTYTIDSPNEFVVTPEMEGVPIWYLVVAGGGSGSSNRTENKTGSGGGGGGGIVTNIRSQPAYMDAGVYEVIVGAGGRAAYTEGDGLNGGNSSINGLGVVAIGGGGGGRMDEGGRNGGSGGGAGFRRGSNDRGAAMPGQGHDGGLGHNGCSGNKCSAGGGGGGAGGVGGDAWKNTGGPGGPGVQYSFDGVQRFYGAGGGGGGNSGNVGGSGVGGNGGRQRSHGGDAAPNSGSGGGGAGGGSNDRLRGGSGGDGIVFIRYEVRP